MPVPAATAVVAPWRERLDPSAVHGVPAHVTVLYPFMPPDEISDGVVRTLRALFAGAAPFDFALARVAWFGDTVVYLAPEPAAPFVALTNLVQARFPAYRPYEGAFDDVTPHLTVGDRGGVDALRRAGVAVEPALPIAARASDVWLMAGSATVGAWRVRARFPLGGGAPAAASAQPSTY
ncbi:MAG TPA: 2'-5' RNA ligase family protein [Acidimicrobiia bacterium]|nr:2'-5' RNA ligase family protein [Acidimicrobiia bacterium]